MEGYEIEAIINSLKPLSNLDNRLSRIENILEFILKNSDSILESLDKK